MKKLELGFPLPQRRKLLDDLARSAGTTSHRVFFQKSNQDRPLYKVPLGFPKYRLKNGRTLAAQAEYLANNIQVPKDLFTKDDEAVEAQKAQHDILLKMIDEKGLLPTLKRQGQREPLYIDSNGFVVNGNRRLCAMRKLDLAGEQDFSSIEVVVLPPANDEEIADLEIALQVAPDVKADYTWYTLGMMLRMQHEHFRHEIPEIAKMFYMRPQDVDKTIAMLLAGEDYLRERGKAGLYHLLDGREYAFKQLVECRKKFGGEELPTRAFVQMAYAITDSPEGDRAYAQIPKVHSYFAPIVQSLLKSGAVARQAGERSERKATKLLGGEERAEAGIELTAVISALSDAVKRAPAVQCIIDEIAKQDERQKDLNEAEYVLKRVERAESALADAVAGWAENTKTDGLAEHLEAIQKAIEVLWGRLKPKK